MGTQDGNYEEIAIPDGYTYDPQQVLDSTVATVLEKYALQPLTVEDILAKRSQATITCAQPLQIPKCKPCLFNIADDPCEQFNLLTK